MSENVKRRGLTPDERSRIAGAYLCGVKPLTIAEKLIFPKSTVYDTIKRLNKTGSEHPPKRLGPSNTLSERDERALAKIVNTDRNLPLALITDKINTAAGTSLSAQTVRKYVRKQQKALSHREVRKESPEMGEGSS